MTTIIRQAKKDYYTRKLLENKTNIKGMWKVSSVLGNKVHHNEPTYLINEQDKEIHAAEMSDEFNSYFVNVGPNLAKSIQTHQGENKWKGESKVLQSFFLGEVSDSDIISVVSKLKNKTSCDSDGLDMFIVKNTIDCISNPLKYIINLSFNTGRFPIKMKVAKIIPLFKSGDRHGLSNYRPISLLSQFSKVIEKMFVEKLDSFIEKHFLLNDSQFGFRSKRP